MAPKARLDLLKEIQDFAQDNVVFWNVTSFGSCKTDFSEERIAVLLEQYMTSQKTTIFIVTAEKTSNLTSCEHHGIEY
jgi:hypothetical protein